MKKTVQCLIIDGPTAKDWMFQAVHTDLDSLQAIVGGSIECLSYAGLELVCNEEGKNEGLEPTLALCERIEGELIVHDVMAGRVIIHGAIDYTNDGAMLGLSPLQFAALAHWRSLWLEGRDQRGNIVVDGPFIKPVR